MIFENLFGPSRPRAQGNSYRHGGSFYLDDPNAPLLWSGGQPENASGIDVDAETALAYSAVFCALEVLAGGLGSVPLEIFEASNDDPTPAKALNAYKLLMWRPNEEMNASIWRECMMVQALTTSLAISEITWRNDGQPAALWPLNSHLVTTDRVEGRLVYRYPMKETRSGKKRDYFLPHEVFIIPGLSREGLRGIERIHKAAQSIGLALAAETYGAAYFGNGAAFKGYFTHPGNLSPGAKENIRQDYLDHHEGPADAFEEVPVLEEGLKFIRTTDDPDKAQATATRKFQITDVARWFNLPPHKLKDLEGYKYNSVEGEQRAFITDSLRPWAVKWEQEVHAKLLPVSQPSVFYPTHDWTVLDATSMEDRYTALAKGIDASLLKPDEGRALINKPPWHNGLGQAFRAPGNFVLITEDGKVHTQVKGAGTPTAGDEARNQAQVNVVERYRMVVEHLLTTCHAKIERRRANQRVKDPDAAERAQLKYARQELEALSKALLIFSTTDQAILDHIDLSAITAAAARRMVAAQAEYSPRHESTRLLNAATQAAAKATGSRLFSTGCALHPAQPLNLDTAHPPLEDGCTCLCILESQQ